jgi:hypothetical protein
MLHLLDLTWFDFFIERCTNQNCMATMASIGATYRLWNRDLVGALNMLDILWCLRHIGRIPQRFRRARLAQRLTFRFDYRWTMPRHVQTVRVMRGLLYWFNQGSNVNRLFLFPTLSLWNCISVTQNFLLWRKLSWNNSGRVFMAMMYNLSL